jgi:hypothetical protein
LSSSGCVEEVSRVDLRVALRDEERLHHVPDGAHMRQEHGYVGEAPADLVDSKRGAEGIVERVDQHDQAVDPAGVEDRVEEPVVGEVIAVHRGMELEALQPSLGQARDLGDGLRVAGVDLPEADRSECALTTATM